MQSILSVVVNLQGCDGMVLRMRFKRKDAVRVPGVSSWG
jgi:hypothetical protein